MVGIINLCKPAGMTSHDAVNAVRRLCGQRRVGHGGTLDPGACGVLPIFLGWATRLLPYIESCKAYRAEMTLGIDTDTQDAAGVPLTERNCAVTPQQLTATFAALHGEIEQVPPMTSAVRVGGRRLYELARTGQDIPRPARRVQIYALHIRHIWPEDAGRLGPGTRVLFDVECSAGTYVRTLCADIGAQLGCGAHMSFLVRTQAAGCYLAKAATLEELSDAAADGRLAEMLLPPEHVLQHLSAVSIDQAAAEMVRSGRSFPTKLPAGEHPCWRVHDETGRLLALAKPAAAAGWLQPIRVFGAGDQSAEEP